MRLAVLLLLTCLALPGPARAVPGFNTDPAATRLVTEDLARFWAAWDAAASAPDEAARAAVFQAQYLDAGTPGLREFTRLRIGDGATLARSIAERPQYYAALRPRMPALEAAKPGILATLAELKIVYPEAVFPDVYFLIGAMNSGGTISPTGLMIGVDMYGRGAGVPMHELGEWHQAVVGDFDDLPVIVAHEWVHFQQDYGFTQQPTLLEASINEGVADFLAEFGAGRHINQHVHAWAEPRSAALWQEFQAVMHGRDYTGWLYGGSDEASGRPADLGYWMGYRIARAYYARAEDKAAAVHDLLHIRDFDAFLAASRVAEEFASEAPPAGQD